MKQGWIVAVAVALIAGAGIGSRAAAQSAPAYTRCAAVGVPVNGSVKRAAERGDYNAWVPIPSGWTAVGGATSGSTPVVIACTTLPPTTDGSWSQDPL